MSSIGNKQHMRKYVYDFAVDGGTVGTIDLSAKANEAPLPDNALVKEVHYWVETAVVGSSSTVAWGNTTDADGYSGTAIAEASLSADAVGNGAGNGAALLWDDTNDHYIPFLANSDNDRDFVVTIGTGALTAGKIHFFVEYYLP